MEPTNRITFAMCQSQKIQQQKILKENLPNLEISESRNQWKDAIYHHLTKPRSWHINALPLNFFSFYFSKTLLFSIPSKNPNFLSSTFTHLATAHVLIIALPGSQISSFRGISYGAIFEFENGFMRFLKVI